MDAIEALAESWNRIGGLRIIEDPGMLDPYEDWSQVRSPSRAKRRMRRHHRFKKFKQRMIVRYRPKKEALRLGGALVMHPVMADALRNELRAQGDGKTEG
jgi:hypothetical protein